MRDMKNNERTIEKNRKEFSMKAMYFNRYLLIRYVTALFFFTNLYWLILLLMSKSSMYFIPLFLLFASLFHIAELVKAYSEHTNNAKKTKYFFLILLWTNVFLLLPTFFSSSFTQLYPFLTDEMTSRIIIFSILITGILLSLFILYRLSQIKNNEDKHYKRIKKYEKAVNL